MTEPLPSHHPSNTPNLIRLGILLLATLVWLVWLSSFSWDINSDDALNLARGVERFSVLEFRPHFPGYPGMMAGAHLVSLVTGIIAPDRVLVLFTILSALFIPFLLGWVVYELSASQASALIATLLVFPSPMLSGLALSALSDAPAIAIMLAAIIAAIKKRFITAGLCIGLMLAIRPAYIIIALSFLPFIFTHKHPSHTTLKSLLVALLPIVMVGITSLLFVLSKDGVAYFTEGFRFTEGHFQIWGNTYSANQSPVLSWYQHLSDAISLPLLLMLSLSMLFALFDKNKDIKVVGFICTCYLVAILFTQNPDNLRHFAPLFFLGSGLAIVLVVRYSKVKYWVPALVSLFSFSYLPLFKSDVKDAPTISAINYLVNQAESDTSVGINVSKTKTTRVLGTNYAVNLMREKLKGFAIYDMYYPSSHQALLNRHGQDRVWRLSGIPLETSNYVLQAVFPSRFLTERSLYLYIVK